MTIPRIVTRTSFCTHFKKIMPIGIPSKPENNNRQMALNLTCCLSFIAMIIPAIVPVPAARGVAVWTSKKNNKQGTATKPNPKPKAEVTNDAKSTLQIVNIVFNSIGIILKSPHSETRILDESASGLFKRWIQPNRAGFSDLTMKVGVFAIKTDPRPLFSNLLRKLLLSSIFERANTISPTRYTLPCAPYNKATSPATSPSQLQKIFTVSNDLGSENRAVDNLMQDSNCPSEPIRAKRAFVPPISATTDVDMF